MKKKTKSYRFFLLDENKPGKIVYGGSKILLHRFGNLSVHGFSFPFTGMSRVREALRIQFRPLLGEGYANVSIIPFFTGSEKKTSKGCVFLLFGSEAKEAEERAQGIAGDYSVWPDILALAGEVSGDGLLVWSRGGFISTMWVRQWTPQYYRCVPSDKSSVEEERQLALSYSAQEGVEIENVFLLERDDVSDEEVQAFGMNTLALCPTYEHLDLSHKGTNLIEQREKAVLAFTRASKAAVAFGVVFLILGAGVYVMHRSLLASAASSAESLYNASFEERSRQPLSSSFAKVRSLGTPQVDTSVHALLRNVTAVWEKMAEAKEEDDEEGVEIRIDTLRYGSDNTDIVGTSENNESIQQLRSALEQEGYTPKVDNIQRIPSGELRFNISIPRGGA